MVCLALRSGVIFWLHHSFYKCRPAGETWVFGGPAGYTNAAPLGLKTIEKQLPLLQRPKKLMNPDSDKWDYTFMVRSTIKWHESTGEVFLLGHFCGFPPGNLASSGSRFNSFRAPTGLTNYSS